MDPDYELFLSVVEEGSLAAAARRLKISAPMVSKRLARLEGRLGIELIRRTTRRCLTTNIGQAFYDEISVIVSAARDAEARLASRASALTGELRIRTVSSLARFQLPRILAPFFDTHRGLSVELEVVDRPVDLLSNRTDVEITFSPARRDDATVQVLAPDRRILCASPSYLARRGHPATVEDLYAHDIVAAAITLPWRFKGPNGTFVFDGKSRIQTNSSELPAALAVAGLGIALRSTWALKEDLLSGRLARVLPQYESTSDYYICAVYARSRLISPNVRALIDHLVVAFADFEAHGASS